MTKPKILATATAQPAYTKTTAEIIEDFERHLADQPERFCKKITRIFKYAEVDRRYSIMPAERVFEHTSLEERNNTYIEKVTDLAEEVLRKGLDNAGLQPADIDYIITTSCTGFMIPSVDAYLINRLNMRRDIVRLPVTEMGCAAGVSATIYANDFLKANPGKKVAIVAVESPTSTFQWNDFSMANMVSAAIFGDGAACVILGNDDSVVGPVIQDTQMFHFYGETAMMGFDLKNSGFTMVLDVSVPDKIESKFEEIIFPFLERNNTTIDDVQHLIFHPGGKKIVQIVSDLFGKLGKDLNATKAVLREFGNMSSATVLYVLDYYMNKNIAAGEQGVMLSFGPGFSAQSVLLRWE